MPALISAQNRKAYFDAQGVRNIPTDSDARLKLACDYINDSEFEKAFMLFDPATDQNAQWLTLLGFLYNEKKFQQYNPRAAFSFFYEAATDGHTGAMSQVFRMFLFGSAAHGVEKNIERAFRVARHLPADHEFKMFTLNLAFQIIRKTLNDPKRDLNNVYLKEALEAVKEEPNTRYCNCSTCQKDLQDLRSLTPWLEKINASHPSFQIFNCLLSNEAGIDTVYDMAEKANLLNSIGLMLTINHHVARQTESDDVNYWQMMRNYWQLRRKGVNPNRVVENTFDYGPSYNALAKNGLPVVGEMWPTFQGGERDGNLIGAGPGILEDITGLETGEVEFNFLSSPNALIFKEDLDVLSVLSFGYDRHIFPSIDVPSARSLQIDTIREKITKLPWLIHTELGRTLYATDVWAGELSWHIDEFDIIPANTALTQKFNTLKTRILSCDGENTPENYATVINVNPKTITIPPIQRTSVRGGIRTVVKVNGASLGVDGGFMHEDAKTNVWVHRNSSEYQHTRRTRILTDNFNDVASIFPVYERLRQLIALSYGLKALRESGFQPSVSMMQRIGALKSGLEQRAKKHDPHQYAIYLPLITKPKGQTNG